MLSALNPLKNVCVWAIEELDKVRSAMKTVCLMLKRGCNWHTSLPNMRMMVFCVWWCECRLVNRFTFKYIKVKHTYVCKCRLDVSLKLLLTKSYNYKAQLISINRTPAGQQQSNHIFNLCLSSPDVTNIVLCSRDFCFLSQQVSMLAEKPWQTCSHAASDCATGGLCSLR